MIKKEQFNKLKAIKSVLSELASITFYAVSIPVSITVAVKLVSVLI